MDWSKDLNCIWWNNLAVVFGILLSEVKLKEKIKVS
jgi:hypothetical protein